MPSPWDPPDRALIVCRSEEANVIGVTVWPPDASGRFAIEFRVDGDRVLRLSLPADQLQALADVLHELAALGRSLAE